MTGIERLREFVAGISPITAVCGVTKTSYDREHMEEAMVRLRDFLSDIADQIERETQPKRDATEDVSVSAYDLLPADERDAVAWVREHGGLKSVKSRLGWVVGHCSTKQQLDFDFWLSGRVMYELGFEEDMADRDEVERRLLARLMPDGCEWPRYESGEMVQIGDDVIERFIDDPIKVRSIEFRDGYTFLREVYKTDRTILVHPGERVKRPAPKVLDADGAEIRVGDTVWHVETGEQCKVVEVDSRSVSVDFRVDGDGTKHTGSILPANLTHRAPVLAADGRPLRKGEHVWNVNGDDEGYVFGFIDDGRVTIEDGGITYPESPDQLTHERPDSWERLEEDASLDPFDYCVGRGVADMGADHLEDARVMARDLVRRARALAERDAK